VIASLVSAYPHANAERLLQSLTTVNSCLLETEREAVGCRRLRDVFSTAQGRDPTRSSADAFPRVVFLVQLIDLHPLEIAARDDAPDPFIFDDRKMAEAAITHRA
jgi:hypothetical protein